jgi:DNA-binding XRE family transcriptional regulator
MNDVVAHRATGATRGEVASLFEPDVLVPSQFFGARRHIEETGPRALMAAVLEQSVDLLLGAARSHRTFGSTTMRRELAWIESTDRTYVFAFENVCDVLGIDVDAFRRQVRARIADPVDAPAPPPSAWDRRRMVALRSRLGLSQVALAQRIGVTKSWVGQVEAGLFAPTAIAARRALDALDQETAA